MTFSLTPEGQQQVENLAAKHAVSAGAALVMLEAVARGGGSMAQFNHPEFGGNGQWMRGGMTMVGDMFNHGLKARVDALCADLAALVHNDPALVRAGSFQSQSHSQYLDRSDGIETEAPTVPPAPGMSGSLFTRRPVSSGRWWPASLPAHADSVGTQNDMRYAVFGEAQRLAVDRRGQVTVYDTLDHRIGGISQQQAGDASLSFSSQHGAIDLRSLPVVDGRPDAPRAMSGGLAAGTSPSPAGASTPGKEADIADLLQKLSALHDNGVLTAEEFAAKKRELLARI